MNNVIDLGQFREKREPEPNSPGAAEPLLVELGIEGDVLTAVDFARIYHRVSTDVATDMGATIGPFRDLSEGSPEVQMLYFESFERMIRMGVIPGKATDDEG